MKALARLTGTLLVLSLALLLGTSAAQAAFPGENGDIAYSRPFDHGYHVFAYDTKTGKSKQLTNDSLKGDRDNTVAYDPSYGPTGKRIVFLNLVDTKGVGGRRADVYVMHSDGSHIKRLTHSPAGEYEPTFTADGKQIAYSLRGKTYLIPTNGKGPRTELTAALPNGGTSASFSSDGTKVAVWSRDGGDADIFVMDADGSNPVNITAGSSDDEYAPDFSPDGSRIAFISSRLDSKGDLFTMAADGTDVFTVHAADDLEAGDPAYSPDGEQIAFVTRLTARSAVRVSTVSAAGGQPKELKDSGPISDGASWGVK
jgi:Tol biopolymer transport system component